MHSNKLDYIVSDYDDTGHSITIDIPKDLRPVTYTKYVPCVNKKKQNLRLVTKVRNFKYKNIIIKVYTLN